MKVATVAVIVLLVQGTGRLQPGTGIVTGVLKTSDGKPAAGVRVGAVEVDDPTASSFLSVTETDSNGRYRLINIPVGHYYIAAGKLTDLRYFPKGEDRSKAAEVEIEAARIRSDVDFIVPAGSQRPPSTPTPSAEMQAFRRIMAETDPYRRAQLASDYVKNRHSMGLVDVYMSLMKAFAAKGDTTLTTQYADKALAIAPDNIAALIEVSRTYAGMEGRIDKALQHAEKATTLALRLKSQPVSGTMKPEAWSAWVATINSSAQANLEWLKQLDAWQRKRFQSFITPRPSR